ncbi:hypothetical protein KM043_009755 [Ampulex compressa]|nr:hypothetical protein KM043_009755 [Ampulex compressa]
MSGFLKDGSATELLFRSAEGNQITLNEEIGSNTDGHKKNVINSLIPVTVATLVLILQFKSVITSVNKDTLLVVKSVGIYIEGNRTFHGFDSREFLAWDTVEEIFINEVITGQKVLYYLTFIVKETIGGKDTIRLIPLFQDLIPERKCLKNIYKFIFKYHRVVRNNKEFVYGKELMKIIRRIIKCQPRQGQQFGTQHLLVTYNHTFWTRQDKMFAVLKFKDHMDAVTFSRAFVLTIQFSCSPQRMEKNTSNFVATFNPDHSLISEKEDTMVESKVMESESQKSAKDSADFCLNNLLNSDMESSTLEEEIVNNVEEVDKAEDMQSVFSSSKELDNLNVTIKEEEIRYNITQMRNEILFNPKIHESKPFRSNKPDSKNYVVNTCEESIKQWLSGTHKTDTSQSEIGNCNKWEAMTSKELNILGEQEPPSIYKNVNITNTEALGNVNKITFQEKIEQNHCAMDISDNINNNISIDESNMDAINLPYQYLIEKEIEDSKNKMNSSVSSPDIKKSAKLNSCANGEFLEKKSGKKNLTKYVIVNSRSDETHRENVLNLQQSNKRNIVTFKEHPVDERKEYNSISNKLNKIERRKQKGIKELEKKAFLPDEKTLRSSDITNLVMEGLMFTIRQDQDSMAVIEQKTKLEPDEVLENSEKAETKLGEKCLVNSSLLKLENLITMIEAPSRIKEQSKCPNSSVIGKHLSKNPKDTDMEISLLQYKDDNEKQNKNKESISFEDTRAHLWDTSTNVSLSSSSTDSSSRIHLQNNSKKTSNVIKSIMMDIDEEVEEDIIPEVLQNKTYESADFSQKLIPKEVRPITSSINKSFLTENTNKEKLLKNKATVTNCKEPFNDNLSSNAQMAPKVRNFNNNTNNKTHASITHDSIKSSSNIPRIVSSKIITMDQLPIALRKAFRSKLRTKQISSNIDNEILNCNMPPSQKEDDDPDYVSLSSSTFTHNDTVCDANVSSAENNRDINECEQYKAKVEIKALQNYQLPMTILKDKTCTPCKLQDITQEFYQDLLNLQPKKKTTMDQRCLRQRRKSLSVCSSTKTDDTQVEMFKLIQDITRGARVVVKRISTKHISSILGKRSSLAKCLN